MSYPQLQANRKQSAASTSVLLKKNRFKPASKSTRLALFLIMLLLASLSSPRLLQLAQCPRTRYVPGEYPTIQQAVNSASNGDTIQVSSEKIYFEHVVVPDTINQLQILGNPANPATTIVDGSPNGTVFRLDGTRITIKGFTIRNAGAGYTGIASTRDNPGNDYQVISNNIIETCEYGISLGKSNGNTITNNTLIDNSVTGVNLEDSDNNIISQNTIQQSAYGIKMITSLSNNINHNRISETSYSIHITVTSTGNTMSYNNVSGESAGILINSDSNIAHHNIVTDSNYGIWIYNCKNTQIYYNQITRDSYGSSGIRIQWSTETTLSFHNVNNNRISQYKYGWGIEIVNSNNNTFTGNWIQRNVWGVSLSGSAYNTFYHNNFMNNSIQATETGINVWDKNGNGNHWSDYPPADDSNGDGIGETPYKIIPSQDNYPIIHTWSEHDIAITNVTLSTNEAPQGTTIQIDVTVRNNANTSSTENFQLTTRYNSSTIGTQPVPSLTPGETRILTFNWNTTTVPPGNYIIKAEASVVVDELNTDNNHHNDGTVRITASITGDINHDGTINEEDLELISQAYGSTSQTSDLNNDGIVNVSDIWILGKNYGKGV